MDKHERIPKMHYIQRGSLLSPSNLHIKTISIYQEHQYIIKTGRSTRRPETHFTTEE